MLTTNTKANYSHDTGCSDCGAKRPAVDYTEYVRYDLKQPVEGEEGESSGEPFVALVACTDTHRMMSTEDYYEIVCDGCGAEFTNIEIGDWRDDGNDRPLPRQLVDLLGRLHDLTLGEGISEMENDDVYDTLLDVATDGYQLARQMEVRT